MRDYFPKPTSFEVNVKVELYLSNYATTGVDTSNFTKKTDLAYLKSDIDKLDIEKLRNLASNLSNLKSKVHKLDIDKLVPVPVDLSKLSYVVKYYVVKKDVYNAKIKNIEDKVPDIANFSINTTVSTKINEIKIEIPSVTNIALTVAFTAVIYEVKKKSLILPT